MIDPIGTRPSATSAVRNDTVKPLAVAAKPAPVQTATEPTVSKSVTTNALAAEMAASAPVDQERVDIIRAAIAHGRFPITPATIADRIIAYAEGWRPS
jgi:negative regulator of flagellin synthesis FlgM